MSLTVHPNPILGAGIRHYETQKTARKGGFLLCFQRTLDIIGVMFVTDMHNCSQRRRENHEAHNKYRHSFIHCELLLVIKVLCRRANFPAVAWGFFCR
jgi:hypothetical protein